MPSAHTKPSSIRSWILFNSWTPTTCSSSWRPEECSSAPDVGRQRRRGRGQAGGKAPCASGDPLPGPLGGRPLDEELGPEPEVDLLPLEETNKEVDVGYQPPRAFSADEMVDYLSDVAPTPTPAPSDVQALSSPVPDPAAAYWLQVVAGLQRCVAATITTAVEDVAAAGASDKGIMDAAGKAVARWRGRSLDLE